jgi:hypothetical protein
LQYTGKADIPCDPQNQKGDKEMKIKVPDICKAINDRRTSDNAFFTNEVVFQKIGYKEIDLSDFIRNDKFTPIQRLDVFVLLLDDIDVAKQWAKLVSTRNILQNMCLSRSFPIRLCGLSFLSYILEDISNKKLEPITPEYLSKVSLLTCKTVDMDIFDSNFSVQVLQKTYDILTAKNIQEIQDGSYLPCVADSASLARSFPYFPGGYMFSDEMNVFYDYTLDTNEFEKLVAKLVENEFHLQFLDAITAFDATTKPVE